MRPTLGWLWHEQVQGPCLLPLRQREAEGPMSFPVAGVHHQGPPHRAEREPNIAGFGASQPPIQPPGFTQRQLHPGVACTGEAGEDTPKWVGPSTRRAEDLNGVSQGRGGACRVGDGTAQGRQARCAV